MNDLDKIYEEAGKDIWSNRPHWTKDDIAMIEHFIKSACEKATEPIAEALGCEGNSVAEIMSAISDIRESRAAHASDPTKHKRDVLLEFCSNPDAALNALHQAGWQIIPKRAAHLVEKDAAGTSDDNCRKCGRPLGWFEPGLCEDCRAVHASEAKPLERCSSNPHYEAHFGDEPATTAHASEQP